MKITDIKQQIKRPDRYSIFIDGKFAFGFSESALLASHLSVGQEFTKQELADLLDDAKLDKAYGRTLGLLARRARSEWEIRDYLKRNDYDQTISEVILARLRQTGFIDDSQFARSWVENRRLLKQVSKRRLEQELRQKRIDDATIKTVLSEDVTDELSVLRELIERKQKQARYQDTQKLIAYLGRQGFNYEDIKAALNAD